MKAAATDAARLSELVHNALQDARQPRLHRSVIDLRPSRCRLEGPAAALTASGQKPSRWRARSPERVPPRHTPLKDHLNKAEPDGVSDSAQQLGGRLQACLARPGGSWTSSHGTTLLPGGRLLPVLVSVCKTVGVAHPRGWMASQSQGYRKTAFVLVTTDGSLRVS